MAVATAKQTRSVQINVRLTPEQDEVLSRIAESPQGGGTRSAAVAYLVDLHAGAVFERAKQDEQLAAVVPFEVVRWKKPKLSRDLIAYVAGIVRGGNLVETACDLAGISPRQRSSWLKQGRNDQQEGRESLQADFVSALAQADAENEVERVARIQATDEWRALGYLLERQKPDRYGERKRIDGKVQHSLVPMIDYDRLTVGETRTLVELLRKASPELDEPGVGRFARPAIELVPEDVIDAVDGDWTEAPALESGPPPTKAPALVDEKPGS